MKETCIIIDKYDEKLLYELDKDSSLSLSKLSRKIKRSKQFTLFRLKRLENKGIITHYNAIIDMAKLGYFTFRIYIKFQQMTDEEQETLVKYLKTRDNIWTIAVCHGKWDLAFFIGTNKIETAHEEWDLLMEKYKKNIEKYNFSLYSPVYNFNRVFFLDSFKRREIRTYGESGNITLDEKDWLIIKNYAPNVRQSIIELSRKTNIDPKTIIRRIKNLEKEKIICGHKIGLNIYKLGYNSYRIDLDLLSTEKNSEIKEYCLQHKNIYQINKTLGSSDFEIELVVKDLSELLKIINDIKKRFKDVVRNASYFSYSTYFLLNYIPD